MTKQLIFLGAIDKEASSLTFNKIYGGYKYVLEVSDESQSCSIELDVKEIRELISMFNEEQVQYC